MKLLRRLLLALWAGALLAVGGLAAPTLFSLLPQRHVAGQVAGELFRQMTWISAAVALVVAALWSASGARRLAAWSLVPALLLLASEYLVRPMFAAAHATGAGPGFALWHALATALYVAASIVVVVLLIVELRR